MKKFLNIFILLVSLSIILPSKLMAIEKINITKINIKNFVEPKVGDAILNNITYDAYDNNGINNNYNIAEDEDNPTFSVKKLDFNSYYYFENVSSGNYENKTYYDIEFNMYFDSDYVNYVCSSDALNFDLYIGNSKVTPDSFSCTTNNIKTGVSLDFIYDFREYYDISNLNFNIKSPTIGTSFNDYSISSPLEGLSFSYEVYNLENNSCSVDEYLVEDSDCLILNENADTFEEGKRYAFLISFAHNNYYFSKEDVIDTGYYYSNKKVLTNESLTTPIYIQPMKGYINYYISYEFPNLKSTYNVKFDGTNLEDIVVNANDKITEPKNVVKNGYVFKGWYLDKELTIKYDFSKYVTRDLTLYSKWEISNPKTGDNIYKIIIIGIISLIILVVSGIYIKKANK